jgi:hypothetical protein
MGFSEGYPSYVHIWLANQCVAGLLAIWLLTGCQPVPEMSDNRSDSSIIEVHCNYSEPVLKQLKQKEDASLNVWVRAKVLCNADPGPPTGTLSLSGYFWVELRIVRGKVPGHPGASVIRMAMNRGSAFSWFLIEGTEHDLRFTSDGEFIDFDYLPDRLEEMDNEQLEAQHRLFEASQKAQNPCHLADRCSSKAFRSSLSGLRW